MTLEVFGACQTVDRQRAGDLARLGSIFCTPYTHGLWTKEPWEASKDENSPDGDLGTGILQIRPIIQTRSAAIHLVRPGFVRLPLQIVTDPLRYADTVPELYWSHLVYGELVPDPAAAEGGAEAQDRTSAPVGRLFTKWITVHSAGTRGPKPLRIILATSTGTLPPARHS